jgi:Mg/Co/Ni transporter MgtE
MSLRQKTDLYDCLCAAVRKPLSEGGSVALTATLHGQTTDQIVLAVSKMTNQDALAVFNWLDDWRASELLHNLKPDQAQYVVRNAPPGRLSRISL